MVGSLRDELIWSYVEEKEDECGAVMERHELMMLKVKKCQDNILECKKEEEKHEATISDFEKRASENAQRETPLLSQMRDLKEQERQYHREVVTARQEEATLNDQYKRIKAQIDGLVKRIETETQKLNDGNHEKRTALLKQQKQAELERKKLEKEEAEERDRSVEFDRDVVQVEREIGQLEAKREYYRNAVANAESQMAKLRSTKTNRMTAFGTNIPQLLRLIDQDQRWRQKPVGPIGAHLKLKDRKWAPVLESVIGNTLNAFCVTNHHDRNILQELKRRANCNDVPILTGSDEAFDYSSGEPEEGVLTILRVLHIESDYLTRQLINSVHIEQSALVNARVDGDTLMRRRVRNVKTCFSMDMFRLGGGNVGSSTQTLQAHHGPPRLSLDIEAQMQEVQERHAEAQTNLRNITHEMETYQMKRNAAMEGRRESRQKVPHLQRQARQRHAEMERIDEELREDEPTNIAALVEAKKDLEVELEKITDQFQDVAVRVDANEKLMKPLIEERAVIKKKVELMQEQSRTLKPKLDDAAKKRLQAHRDGMHWETELEKKRGKEMDLNSSAKALEKEVLARVAKAEEHCQRVPVTKSSKELEKEIESVEHQVVAATREHGQDPEAITLLVQQCSAAFQKSQAEISTLKEVYADLEDAIRLRLGKWRLFRRLITVRAKNAFANYLNNRGYNGNILFDHNKGTLKLSVQTEETSGPRHDKDPKSLSGGEKSFATICLLLALWESIGCPIRCLDEFDVFMDAVNRKISMSMMVSGAMVEQVVLTTVLVVEGFADAQYLLRLMRQEVPMEFSMFSLPLRQCPTSAWEGG